MELELRINGVVVSLEAAPNESLLALLRREGYYSVKRGCETGKCGACTVLVEGMSRPSCVTLAAQADGCALMTLEGLAEQGQLHPLQRAFIEVGAVQCGFCTPGMLLSAYELLKRTSSPTEDDVRDALSGNGCRCSCYEKPVQAVLRAAAMMRGEHVEPLNYPSVPPINAHQLATGKPVFAADISLPEMLHACVLSSPYAHALIRTIDTSKAKALPGIHAVLTYKDVARVAYSQVEQQPSVVPVQDRCALDYLLRYVGDRVAVVAAESPEIAEQARQLIEVEYEVLPPILDPRQALEPGSPWIHPEQDASGIFDATRNVAAHLHSETGKVEEGFAQADLIIENEYIILPRAEMPLEPHTVVTYFDEQERLIVRTNCQAPHHLRRTLAQILNLPLRRIKVLSTQTADGQQKLLLEDLCALLTMATHRPVMLSHSCAEEAANYLYSPHILRMKTGVLRDGTILANQMMLLASTGAYSTHPLITQRHKHESALYLYLCPHQRFTAEILYTNHAPAIASFENGLFQEYFALESHIDEIAHRLGMDAAAVRRKNCLVNSNNMANSNKNVNNQEVNNRRNKIGSLLNDKSDSGELSGPVVCLKKVEEQLDWAGKREEGARLQGRFRRGVGMALTRLGPTSGPHTSGATFKLNEDGSFDLFVSAAHDGSGMQTMFVQIAAEVLGVPLSDILLHPSETDGTPFANSADPAAAFYAGAGAVRKGAEQMQRQILAVAGRMLTILPEALKINNGLISSPTGHPLSVAQVAIHALSSEGRQLMTTASWKVQQVPTIFAASGVEVEVDSETGIIQVLQIISAVDVGSTINPLIQTSQIEGQIAQALEITLSAELLASPKGALLTHPHLPTALDMPKIQIHFLKTADPANSLNAKAIATAPFHGIAPAIANAITNAIGIHLHHLPLTPERVLRAIQSQANK